jgi:hypothetical protein
MCKYVLTATDNQTRTHVASDSHISLANSRLSVSLLSCFVKQLCVINTVTHRLSSLSSSISLGTIRQSLFHWCRVGLRR